MNHNKIFNLMALSLFLELTCFSVVLCQNSISQISPKSSLNAVSQFESKIYPSETVKNIQDFGEATDFDNRILSSVLLSEKSTIREINEIETNNIEVIESSGRYHGIISPTKRHIIDDDLTREGHFLVKGGRQARSSRPQIQEMNTAIPKINVNSDLAVPRQNNADISGIISGIVKILNGNVNVHTNNQGTRRPPSNRINNRGPPRISEAQVPNGNEIQEVNHKIQSLQEAPLLRPFLTGVPIPEQIVPSMQQNYRPGFVSQNRPPWKRTKPPISRRPIPQYTHQHIPTHLVSNEQQSTNSDNFNKENPITDVNEEENNYDEIASLDDNDQLLSVIKDKNKNSDSISAISNENISSSIITIIESTSEVNIVDHSIDEFFPSTEVIDKTSSFMELEPSTTDILSQNLATHIPTPTEVLSSQMSSKPTTIISNYHSTAKDAAASNTSPPSSYQTQFIPRPGMVLDDPEFNSAQKVQHQRPRLPSNLPAGYGEIFDVTLSAVQFGDSNVGSHQTINIKPYGVYDGTDILITPSGDQGFVSIDGKRTYINLFGESTDAPLIRANSTYMAQDNQLRPTNVLQPGITGSGIATVAETESYIRKQPQQNTHQHSQTRLVMKPKIPPHLPPVLRIDTCIVGDDSTCDKAQNERCRIENGVSSCHCRQGYARRKHRDICRKIVSLVVSLRIDRYNEKKISWESSHLNDSSSEFYRSLKYESLRAIDSAMSMTPFSDEFLDATVNNIYQGDAAKGIPGVFVNLTLMIEESGEMLRSSIKNDIQRHLMGVLHRRNNNIGNSALFVESVAGSVSAVVDLNECESQDLNDCHTEATCINIWGSYQCQCNSGLKDPYDQPQKMGRECMSCDSTFCNNRGACSYENGNQVCNCAGFYYGSSCEIDGEVLFVSIGASVAAIFIIILTLICLVMWSRKWQREHKNAIIGSPLFGLGGYMGNAQVKSPIMGTMPYQMTLEDRMRWAQIADVMAQSNHYAAEPSRTLPTVYSGYPNLSGMMGGMTLPHNTLHHNNLPPPPVPLPRLGVNRPSGMRNLENSSSSEEEDRTDLLGRNFQVPRPKSRAASVTSAIYYDVDFSPEQPDYGTSSGIPLSTYGARPPSTTYYK